MSGYAPCPYIPFVPPMWCRIQKNDCGYRTIPVWTTMSTKTDESNAAPQAISKRAGTRWTDEEDAQLIARAKKGMALERIAEEHQRSVKGVRYRLMAHAVDLMREKGLTMEEAGKQMGGIFAKDIEGYMREQDEKRLTGRRAMNGEASPTPVANDELMDLIRDIRDLLRTIVAKK